ncbi:MAG TPA: hypothetical protein VIL34_06005 [Actinopolymorphaceae bacterium]
MPARSPPCHFTPRVFPAEGNPTRAPHLAAHRRWSGDSSLDDLAERTLELTPTHRLDWGMRLPAAGWTASRATTTPRPQDTLRRLAAICAENTDDAALTRHDMALVTSARSPTG